MEKYEIIRRLEKIATHAIHFIGEQPFVMSLDDGIAVKDAVELLKEQKTGHWIYEDRCYGSWTHKCSECGKRMTTAVNTYAGFCWNCGAKMTGETIPEIAYTTDSPTGLSYADEDDLK